MEKLPEELRSALRAMGSDEQAAGEAIGPVEFTLLRIQLQNPLALETLAPISVAGEDAVTEISAHMLEPVTALSEGDWLLLAAEPGAPRTRVVIVAKLDEEQEILLGNQLGMKISTKSFTQLAYLLSTGRAQPLPARHCFSDSLRRAALAAPPPAIEAESGQETDSEQPWSRTRYWRTMPLIPPRELLKTWQPRGVGASRCAQDRRKIAWSVESDGLGQRRRWTH
jgi:hypothetical protein